MSKPLMYFLSEWYVGRLLKKVGKEPPKAIDTLFSLSSYLLYCAKKSLDFCEVSQAIMFVKSHWGPVEIVRALMI